MYEKLEQAAILMQDSAAKPTTAFVDLGYRGVDADNPQVVIVHRGQEKKDQRAGQKAARAAPDHRAEIGHPKANNRMDRCHLKGQTGDQLHAVLCAAGYNIRWLLRMIARKGITFLQAAFCAYSAQGRSWLAAVMAARIRAADVGSALRAALANRQRFPAGRPFNA